MKKVIKNAGFALLVITIGSAIAIGSYNFYCRAHVQLSSGEKIWIATPNEKIASGQHVVLVRALKGDGNSKDWAIIPNTKFATPDTIEKDVTFEKRDAAFDEDDVTTGDLEYKNAQVL